MTAALFRESEGSGVRKVVKDSIRHSKNLGVYEHHVATGWSIF